MTNTKQSEGRVKRFPVYSFRLAEALIQEADQKVVGIAKNRNKKGLIVFFFEDTDVVKDFVSDWSATYNENKAK